MFLPEDGIVIQRNNPAINPYVSMNGTGSSATNGNINALNVRIANSHRCRTNIFTIILQVRMGWDVMLLVCILF